MCVVLTVSFCIGVLKRKRTSPREEMSSMRAVTGFSSESLTTSSSITLSTSTSSTTSFATSSRPRLIVYSFEASPLSLKVMAIWFYPIYFDKSSIFLKLTERMKVVGSYFKNSELLSNRIHVPSSYLYLRDPRAYELMIIIDSSSISSMALLKIMGNNN